MKSMSSPIVRSEDDDQLTVKNYDSIIVISFLISDTDTGIVVTVLRILLFLLVYYVLVFSAIYIYILIK